MVFKIMNRLGLLGSSGTFSDGTFWDKMIFSAPINPIKSHMAFNIQI